MASIEFRSNSYRIIFRYAGEKFSRSLKSDNLKSANASLARLEDNLRRVEQGLAAVPEGADVCQFLLSDGRTTTRAAHKPDQIRILGGLLDKFWISIQSQRIDQIQSYHALHSDTEVEFVAPFQRPVWI